MAIKPVLGFATLLAANAAPLKCGIASDALPACPKCADTFVSSGAFNFWWNWDTEPKLELGELQPATQAAIKTAFTPMLWGQAPPTHGYGFLQGGNDFVLGYNEPDQYGPWCAGPASQGVFGCNGGGDNYRPATSDGWLPAFDPSLAAPLWQTSVNNMTSSSLAAGGTVKKITTPCMAQPATPEVDCTKDPNQPGNTKYCKGWLQGFKRKALTLQCTDFSGKQQNCWDVNDAIVIHAYARTAQEVKDKIKEYYQVFQEDFEGTNGRTKKTLWLTEVAAGSNDSDFIAKFVDDLMNSQDGLTNRDLFGYVEKISWFSEWNFPAFKVGDYTPGQNEVWSSSLFEPTTGNLTPQGERFVTHCKSAANAVMV